MQTPHSLRKFEDEKEPWRKRMSTWSRITVSCLVSLSNRPSAVIARTLYGKSFKYSFSRRHRICAFHRTFVTFWHFFASSLYFFFFFSPLLLYRLFIPSRSNISFFCPIPFKISNYPYFFLASLFLLFLLHTYIFFSFCPLIIHKSSGR